MVLVYPEKGTTSKVNSGGWALYSEPNFQGKVTETTTVELSQLLADSKSQVAYQIGSECFSNDPPTKGNPYKSWFTTIGSARPIRGINFTTVVMRLEMDWSQMQVAPEP